MTYYSDPKRISCMTSRKIVIVAIMISLTSHVLMLYMTSFIDWHGKVQKEEILTVNLKEPPADSEESKEAKKEIKPYHQTEQNAHKRKIKEEDTVDLNSIDAKYSPYLKKIKKKIEDIWVYPPTAFAQEEEGTTIIKFSISDSGALLASNIITSSGSNYLDQGALEVVRSAAPYDPFPQEFQLAQLNIVARFQYKLVD